MSPAVEASAGESLRAARALRVEVLSGAEESTRDIYAGRPSMCRNCGALVGAGESSCALCGKPSTAGTRQDTPLHASEPESSQPPPDIETMRFARAVLTRPSTFTFVFLTINVFIFLLMSLAARGGAGNNEVLLAYGAKQNARINAGEWWRLVTAVFLHLGWLHLIVNTYCLFILGPCVEKLYGAARFVFFWIATGVAGVVAGYLATGTGLQDLPFLGRFLFHNSQDVPSAGASGALFGLVGVLFVFGIKFRHELPEDFKRAFGLGMIPTILINLVIGYAFPYIGNSLHLGGFVAGALLALFVGYKRPGQPASVAVFWRVLQFLALALVVVGFGQVARHMGAAPPQLDNAPVPQSQFLAETIHSYVMAVNEGQAALITAFNKRDTEAINRAVEKLKGVPPLAPQPDQLRLELEQLLVRVRDLVLLSESELKGQTAQQQILQFAKDFQAWKQRYDDWVKAEGANYNMALDEKKDAPATPTPEATDAPPAKK